jgi:hypothetical protein
MRKLMKCVAIACAAAPAFGGRCGPLGEAASSSPAAGEHAASIKTRGL